MWPLQGQIFLILDTTNQSAETYKQASKSMPVWKYITTQTNQVCEHSHFLFIFFAFSFSSYLDSFFLLYDIAIEITSWPSFVLT